MPQEIDETHSPGYANYVLGVLFVVYVFNFIDRQILTILLEPIKQDLGVSDTAMGFLTGFAFALFYTFAGIPIARWADRGVRRSIIALGLTVWSAMTVLSGSAQNFLQLALARVGVGVGEAAGSPPAHSLISDYFPPEKRARALGIYSMGIYVGAGLGLLAGGWIAEFFSWRVAFMVVGTPGLVLALVLRFTVKEPPRGQMDVGSSRGNSTRGTHTPENTERSADTESVREVIDFLLARRSFIWLAAGASLLSFTGYGFATWVPAFLIRVHGMTGSEIGTALGIISGFGGAAGAFLGGAVADRLGSRDPRWYTWVPGFSAFVGIPFLIPFLLVDDHRLALALYIPAVVTGAMYLGPTFAMTQALVKLRMRALAAAVLLFVINIIGLGAGPQVVGILNDLLFDRFGTEAVRYSLLIVSLTSALGGSFYLVGARHLARDLARLDAPKGSTRVPDSVEIPSPPRG